MCSTFLNNCVGVFHVQLVSAIDRFLHSTVAFNNMPKICIISSNLLAVQYIAFESALIKHLEFTSRSICSLVLANVKLSVS